MDDLDDDQTCLHGIVISLKEVRNSMKKKMCACFGVPLFIKCMGFLNGNEIISTTTVDDNTVSGICESGDR